MVFLSDEVKSFKSTRNLRVNLAVIQNSIMMIPATTIKDSDEDKKVLLVAALREHKNKWRLYLHRPAAASLIMNHITIKRLLGINIPGYTGSLNPRISLQGWGRDLVGVE